MNSSLQRLIRLAPPPSNPVASGNIEQWPQIESEIGSKLPQDFKDYIKTYGAGQWFDFFGIVDPFYEWKHPEAKESWCDWMTKRIGNLDKIEEKYKNYHAPFRPHPAPNGLLAFGYDDNGGTLCWQTEGESDSWPIVCLDGKLSEEYDTFKMTLTAFLAGLVREEISPVTFAPDLFPARQPFFRPYVHE